MQIKCIVSICIFYTFFSPYVFSQYESRAGVLLNYIADEYQPPSMNIGDPEKYYWPKAIARFQKYGLNDKIANSYIDTFRANSPFHFTLVGMARIMSNYRDAPAMQKHKISYLNEVFERKDSYNPWTGEGTENHISMSRTSGYLFAQHALEHPQVFPQAHLRLQQMELWIREWAKRLYEHGNAEWNSDIYEVYNLIGWVNLYDFAKDEEIKSIARAVLDFYATEIALYYSWGLPGGPAMRGAGIGNSRYTASNYLGWLWFSSAAGFPFEFQGSQYIQLVHLLTSNYRPPEVVVNLGKKHLSIPQWYQLSRPSYSLSKPSFVKQFFYVSNSFSLGSAASPYGGWTGSTWQMVNWRLVIQSKKSGLPHEIGGNGRFYDDWTGKTSNPFTQIAQHKNVLIQMTKTPRNVKSITESMKMQVEDWKHSWEKDFKKRFPHDTHKLKQGVVNFGSKILMDNESYISFPKDANIQSNDSSYIVELNKSVIVIIPFQSVHPVKEIKVKKQERLIIIDKAPLGEMCGFVVEILDGEKDNWNLGNFGHNQASRVQLDLEVGMVSYASFSDNTVNAIYQSNGWFQEATVDWGYGVEAPKIMMTHPDFEQPDWPSGEGYGRIPYLEVNNKIIDFAENWPLFKGDAVIMENQVLEIDTNGNFYKVDYSEEIPVFSN